MPRKGYVMKTGILFKSLSEEAIQPSENTHVHYIPKVTLSLAPPEKSLSSDKIKQEWFHSQTPGMGDYGDICKANVAASSSPLVIPQLTPRKEFENYFSVEINISEREKKLYMLIFEGPRQNRGSSTKEAVDKSWSSTNGHVHHDAHRASNKPCSLAHSLWNIAKDHSLFFKYFFKKLWIGVQINWSIAGGNCGVRED